MKKIIAYVPVLHEGYRRFFETHRDAGELWLFGPEIVAEFPQLAKEIRQLDPELMRNAIESLGMFQQVRMLDVAQAQLLNTPECAVVLPDEDVSREVAAKYFPRAVATFDPIFLRWDKHNALREKPVVPEERITREQFHRDVLAQAAVEAERSSDIWRHVGAAVVKGGDVVLCGHNAHMPSEHMPYVNGDPRNNFHRGDHVELSTALHAEAGLIAEAARRGLPLDGADMYVTVFPCPPCAKLIAHAGIKTLYCAGGYAILDGEDVLKSRGVQIMFVE